MGRDLEVEGDSILLYDLHGYWAGASIAELLVNQGKKVHIVTPQTFVGADIYPGTLLLWHQRIDGKGVTWTTDANVEAISGNTVTISGTHWTGRQWTMDGIDTVVLACGGTPNDGLYKDLKGTVKELKMVGDCEAPLRIERGIYSAELLGREI